MNYDNEILYIMPGFLNFSLNEVILEIYSNNSEITRKNTKIYSFFGSFPQSIWNGGRPDIGEPEYDIKEMKKVRDYYNLKGIVIAFTFTNPLIKDEHLDDKYCNSILKVFHNGKNEVLINSKVLEQYIRKNYPKYKINQSITTTDKQDYSLDGYHLAVLKKDLNHNFEYLKRIPLEDRRKIELLCNEMCINDCKFTFQHYKEMGEIQLGLSKIDDNSLFGKCKHIGKINLYEGFYWMKKFSKYYISPDDIRIKYVPIGFKYFKMCGREKYSSIGIMSIVDYCINPEFQMDVRTYIIERILSEYLIWYNKTQKEVWNS